MIEAGAAEELPRMSEAVWCYLERTQILSTDKSRTSPACRFEEPNMRQTYYRHVSQGGWPFSTSAHGWPISVRQAVHLCLNVLLSDEYGKSTVVTIAGLHSRGVEVCVGASVACLHADRCAHCLANMTSIICFERGVFCGCSQ